MEQCKTCEFYDEDFDRMMIQHDDILIEGEEERERHYCSVWHDWVSASIFYGKEKCEKYWKKENFSE
ncbi:MAG: hypothetical protein K2J71_07555, partial [Oscillospiraceae bacterium]|nr:hypothetical protein [Oscillospiraceae bacterium]